MYPILFKIPFINLPIYSYGVMLGLSLVVGWYLVIYLGSRDGMPREVLTHCYVWTAISAVIGARLLFVITNFDGYLEGNLVDVFNLRNGGLVAYGGFVGGFIGSWIYLKNKGLYLLPFADAAVPALCSGLGITRIGCLLYGCDYGKPIPDTALPLVKSLGLSFPNWGAKFPQTADQFKHGIGCMKGSFSGAPAFNHHVSINLVDANSHVSALVYPTQVIEIINGWLALGLVLMVRGRTRFRGQAFLFFTMYYGLTRTLMEAIRGDSQRGGLGVLSTSQVIGIATFCLSLGAWVYLSNRAKQDPAAGMDLGIGPVTESTVTPSNSNRRTHKKK